MLLISGPEGLEAWFWVQGSHEGVGYLTLKWIRVCPRKVARAMGAGEKKPLKTPPLWVQNFKKVSLMGAKFAKKVPLKSYFGLNLSFQF